MAPVGGDAREDARHDQHELDNLERQRQSSLPCKAVKEREQRLKEDHLTNHRQRQQPAHPVPQCVAED